MLHRLGSIAVAVACATACAPAPSTTLPAASRPSATELFIPAAPVDDYAADPFEHDAFDAFEAAAQMPLPPDAMVPVSAFLAGVHRRIHGAFVGRAGRVDGALSAFERGHALALVGGRGASGPVVDLATTVTFAVAADDGRVTDLRFGRSSGVDAFDAAAMTSVLRASPFGAPPAEIVAGDGEAHLGWRFHRRGGDPCAVDGASVLAAP